MIGYGDTNDYRGLDELERIEASGDRFDEMLDDLAELIAELDSEFRQVARDSQ